MARTLQVNDGETIEITSPNIVEIWHEGRDYPTGFVHKGLNEVLYLTGTKGCRFVLTDELPDPREW